MRRLGVGGMLHTLQRLPGVLLLRIFESFEQRRDDSSREIITTVLKSIGSTWVPMDSMRVDSRISVDLVGCRLRASRTFNG